tara:strand:- start:1233 stop:2246 length:1014 start_codon:yes stop_codon:yes gene_type:complete
MQVFVNNVRQDSGQAYTVSGTTLTFTSAPSSATGNIYVVFNSVIAGISQTITANTQLRTGVVTPHSIVDDAISETKLKISNSTTNGYVLTANTSASGGLTWQPTATSYTHPNHSGEVTSTADGAQVIADNVVDEANLKISNTPTNGYLLTAQSGNSGGLTWAPAGGGSSTGWSLIQTSNISTSITSLVIQEATSGAWNAFSQLKIVMTNLVTGSADTRVKMSNDGGSTFGAWRQYSAIVYNHAGFKGTAYGWGQPYAYVFDTTFRATSDQKILFQMDIFMDGNEISYSGRGDGNDSGGDHCFLMTKGTGLALTAIDYIEFYSLAWSAGQIRLYGLTV